MFLKSTRPETGAELAEKMTEVIQSIGESRFIRENLNLILDTYYPEQQEGREIILFLSPEDVGYVCMNREESEQLLWNKKMHRHNFYELMYVADGKVYQNIENTRHLYPAGSCCLMNMNIRHLEEYEAYCRVIFLQFTQEYIEQILNFPSIFREETAQESPAVRNFFMHEHGETEASRSYIDFIPLGKGNRVHRLLDRLAVCMQERNQYANFQAAAALMGILTTIFDPDIYTNTPVDLGNATEREIFERISDYIRKKDGQVRRKDLEQKFSYSGDYLYKIVGKYTGLSLYDYSVLFTLEKACTLLETTNATVAEIMEQLGFGNRTQFYRLFRKNYGKTPAQYRREHRQMKPDQRENISAE